MSLFVMPLVWFWVALFAGAPAWGQTGRIEGRAYDRYKKAIGKDEFIPGVAVVAVDSAGKQVAADGKITDKNGHYVISAIAAGDVRVEFRHAGYLDHPTIRDKIKVGALVAARVDGPLYPRDPDDKYVIALAGAYVEIGRATPEPQQTYATQWLRLYKANFPVSRKPALSRELIKRDDAITAAIPQLQDYRELDPERLADAQRQVVTAFEKGKPESLGDAAGLRDLPATVFADLVTEAALRTDATNATRKELIARLGESFGTERVRSSHHLLMLRTNEILEKDLDFKAFANPK